MKVKNLLGLSALLFAAALTSCSSDDFAESSVDTNPDTGTTPQTLHFTAKIGEKGEGTRGLKEEDTYVDAFWKVGERIAVVQGGKKLGEAEVTVVDGFTGGGTIEGDIEGGEAGEVTLIFPATAVGEDGEVFATLLHEQEGTLEAVAEKYDVAAVTATLSVDGSSSTATLADEKPVQFENLYSICKFDFPTIKESEGVSSLTINDSEGNLLSGATLVNAEENKTNVVYLVMAPFKSGEEYVSKQLQFKVTDTEGTLYKASATATVKESKFYKLSVGLKKDEHESVKIGDDEWATTNVGADNPWEYGDWFAWGEVKPKSGYAWDNYKWAISKPGSNGYNTVSVLTKYNDREVYYQDGENLGVMDYKYKLDLEDDAAYVNWGPSWCMPTRKQINDLIKNTKQTYTHNYKDTGVSGIIFRATDGAELFLPMAGWYANAYGNPNGQGSTAAFWSSEIPNPEEDNEPNNSNKPYTNGSFYAWDLRLNVGSNTRPPTEASEGAEPGKLGYDGKPEGARYQGMKVRPVKRK